MKKLIAALVTIMLLSIVSTADARFPRGQGAASGWNGGKAQINTGDVIYGGGYEFVNAILNADLFGACDNSGAIPSNEVTTDGYPIPGSGIMSRGGMCAVFYQPNPNDGGYIRATKVTGKGTVVINGTVLTTATQPSPITISSITGGASTTVVNFSGAHMFTAGMEVPMSGISGTIAALLNGNKFVVASIFTNSITITTTGANGLSGTGGTATYGDTNIGVATGGRYVFTWPNPPPTEYSGGSIRGTIAIYATDATTPISKIAVVPIGSEEVRYDADNQAFSQAHLDKISSMYPGVTRNLNVVHGNFSTEVSWSQRKPLGYISYGNDNLLASVYQASPTGTKLDYTAASGSGTPADKMQITTTFPANAATCGGAGGAMTLTFGAAAPMGVNDAFFIYRAAFNNGTLPTETVTFTGSASGTTLTVTAISAGIQIKPGQTVTGGSFPGGTTIVGYGTGSGGTGTYILSTSVTQASTTLTGSSDLVIYPAPFYVTAVVGNAVTSFSTAKGGASVQVSSCGTAGLTAQATVMDEVVTFSVGTTTVNWLAHPPLSVGDPVACVAPNAVAPSNLDPYKTSYYVQSVPNANSITLSATSGGAALIWTGSPSGTLYCLRQPTLKLSGGTAYPIRDGGFNALSYGGNSQPLAKCFAQNFCQGTLTFDAGIGAWSLIGASRAAGSRAIIANWPPEIYLKYAIALKSHAWIVSPQYALDPISDYMPSLIKMYKDGAPSWMIPRFEGINECWNGTFYPTIYTIFKSKANWPASTVNGYNVNAECGKIASTLGQVAQQIYGGGTVGNSYHMVQGVQTGLANTITAASQYDERMNTTLYSGQTPGTQQGNLTGAWGTITFSLNPAYNYVTVIAPAQYYTPATYGTSQETTWANQVTQFSGVVTGTTLTISSVNGTYNRAISAGDYLYGGFLNQNPTIVAQLTGTGGAACPSVTCTGAVGTFQITQNLGTLSTNAQDMAAIAPATASAYAATSDGLTANCALASGTLTVSSIDYPVIDQAMTFGPPIVMGSGINIGTAITALGSATGGNGTYVVSGTQTLASTPCKIGLFSVTSVINYSTNIYNWAQGFTNLAGKKPELHGYEGGYSPDYRSGGSDADKAVNRLRYFGKLPAIIGTLNLQNQQNFVNVGGKFPSQFNITGPQPSSLVWSVLEDLYQAPTPQWNTLKSFSTP